MDLNLIPLNKNLGFFWPTSKNNSILGKDISVKKGSKSFNCITCGLYRGCKSPKMKSSGAGEKGIFVLAEYPGQREDEEGSQLVGESGQLFRRVLSDFDIDLDRDCRKYYSVNCRTPDGRIPKSLEIDCCRQRVFEEINIFKPKVILLLGDVAVESLFGHRWKKDLGGINKWRGWVIPDRDVGAWVIPTFNPFYIIRDGGGGEEDSLSVVETIFRQDLKNVVRYNNKKFPQFTKEEDKVSCLTDVNSINNALEKILIDKPELISFDYETTGLKPQAEGHKIVCCSISDHSERAISFPLLDGCIPLLKEILMSRDIGKISHGLKFEESWSRNILGIKVNNWKWCSMLATHVLDNRKDRITSLKFQTFVNFGVINYDSHIESYLKSSDDEDSGGNSFNKIHLAPMKDLLVYCGLDSMFAHRLALKQMKQIEAKGLQNGYDLFFKGSLAFADLEDRGICVDTNYCDRQRNHLKRRIKYIKDKLYGSSEVKEWRKIFKDKFNIDSNSQLAKILFEHLKIKPTKVTDKGNYSVDSNTLEKIDVPIVKNLLEMRKLNKVEGTYLSGLQDEVVDGVIHPFFHLHTVISFRSCVAKGTKILAIKDFNIYPDGMPIEEIKVGDFVWCFDNNLNQVIRQVVWAGKTGYKKVIRLHWESTSGLTEGYFTYDSPSVKGFIDVTPEHLIRLCDGSYVCAKDVPVNPGDGFYGNAKDILHFYQRVKIKQIEQLDICVDVYDIEVEEFHNFIANGICVHNSSSQPNFQNFPVRDEQVKTIIRKAIVPRKGNQLLEIDYCFVGDTLVETIAGKRSIKDIVDNYDKEDIYIYCYNTKENRIGVSKVSAGKLTQQKAEVWQVVLDNDESVLVTPNHSFMMRDGKYKKVIDLNSGDSLMPLYIETKKGCGSKVYYKKVYLNNGQSMMVHNLIALDVYGITIKGSDLIVHHCNGNGTDNTLSNLQIMTRKKHMSIHSKQGWCKFPDVLNHKVKSIKFYGYSDVYNITVDKYHNYALGAGVIVKNCGIEVKISSCVHKDPKMLEYIHDNTTDMHRDMSMELFLLEENEVSKESRYCTKNGFVFPEFYGDYYESCANNIWQTIDKVKARVKGSNLPLKEHLFNMGIKSLKQFINHVQDVEYKFWNERFAVYTEWKERHIEEYYKRGYFDILTGFRCSGVMRRNSALNLPIQGPAFHCLMWSLIRLNEIAKKERWESQIIGQIHDSMVIDCVPNELEYVMKTAKRVMCHDIREFWDWIIVPLDIEAEVTPVDKPWLHKEAVKF